MDLAWILASFCIFSCPVRRQIFDDAPGQTFYMIWELVIYRLMESLVVIIFQFWVKLLKLPLMSQGPWVKMAINCFGDTSGFLNKFKNIFLQTQGILFNVQDLNFRYLSQCMTRFQNVFHFEWSEYRVIIYVIMMISRVEARKKGEELGLVSADHRRQKSS